MQVTPAQFDVLKAQFLADIRTVVSLEGIPAELIINWDQTGIKFVPVSCWTHEKKGSTQVEIAGVEDKRQITATFVGTMSGQFLPAQIIYGGKLLRVCQRSNSQKIGMLHSHPINGQMKTP